MLCHYIISKVLYSHLYTLYNINMTKIELILINDFSSDNLPIIIKKLLKIDKRMKIIDNKNNKETLYSNIYWNVNVQRKLYV